MRPLSHARRVLELVHHWQPEASQSPPAGLRPPVAHSWHRSLACYGLDPVRCEVPVLLDSTGLAQRCEQLGPVHALAIAEMRALFGQIAGSGYSILLSDAEGSIIHRETDPALSGMFSRAGLVPGANWSESRVGTNGIGTAIHTRQAVTIHRDEHFLADNTALSCTAVPIRAPTGEMLAVLDASSIRAGDTRAAQRHTMALVNLSVRTIENALLRQSHGGQWILRLQPRPGVVGPLEEGLLAFDGDGRIVGTNAAALIQLGLDSHGDLLGDNVCDALGVPLDQLQGELSREGVFRELRGDCLAVYAGVIPPRGRRSRGEGMAPASPAQPAGRGFPGLRELGASVDPAMRETVCRASRLLGRDVPFLLSGETGTGKEVLARAIHGACPGADRPFVAVNCGALPAGLIESELFGYSAGAFTGARRGGASGKILQADGGTLFLDEIGDMPLELQTRLLRVLEQGEVTPLGGERGVAVRFALISATHRPLTALMAEGRFRDDLYYRLNGLTLSLPPLRERRDLPDLIRSMLVEECAGDAVPRIEDTALERLLCHHWPGNLRQLRHVLRAAAALCDEAVIRIDDLPPELRGPGPAAAASAVPAPASAPAQAERRAGLLAALHRHRWNVSGAARELGVSRNTFYRRMHRLGITVSQRNRG